MASKENNVLQYEKGTVIVFSNTIAVPFSYTLAKQLAEFVEIMTMLQKRI